MARPTLIVIRLVPTLVGEFRGEWGVFYFFIFRLEWECVREKCTGAGCSIVGFKFRGGPLTLSRGIFILVSGNDVICVFLSEFLWDKIADATLLLVGPSLRDEWRRV